MIYEITGIGEATYVAFIFMTIYIYSDESGTFDFIHNEYFIFGGIIFFSKEHRDVASRKYSHVERVIKNSSDIELDEIKACYSTNKVKGKLYRSLNREFKFCVVIKQREINQKIYDNKKHKQRYLDYAYKIVLKKCMETLIENEKISPVEVRIIHVHADEHFTATDGIYELTENLLNEFKNGTFNLTWDKHYKPIFPKLKYLDVQFCDSKTEYLIRAADIIANHCYHEVSVNQGLVENENNMFVYYLPTNIIGLKGLEYFENQSF